MKWAFLLPEVEIQLGEPTSLLFGLKSLPLYKARGLQVLDARNCDVDELVKLDNVQILKSLEISQELLVIGNNVPEQVLTLTDRVDCVSLEAADPQKPEVQLFEERAATLGREIIFLEPDESLTLEGLIIFTEE